MANSVPSPLSDHRARSERLEAATAALDRRANRISLARLLLFGAAVVFAAAGISQASIAMLGGAGIAVVAFVLAVAVHARTIAERDLSTTRREVHLRHDKRLTGGWMDFPSTGSDLLDPDHPYAHDIDLVGPGSLFQRIDVTHTVHGERCLAGWLGSTAPAETISARQRAVDELSGKVELRQELEVAAAVAAGQDKLDAEPFLAFTRSASWFADKPWLVATIRILPPTTLALLLAWQLGLVTGYAFLAALVLQLLLSLGTTRRVNGVFDLIAARRGFVEAFAKMLALVESADFEATALVEIQKRLESEGVPPSSQLGRLDRWAGLADFRTQAIVHIFANPVLLWDLNVLERLENWNRSAGSHATELFSALGELEALASLATLRHGDPSASFPEVSEGGGVEAKAIAHPLLSSDARVANDVRIAGPGRALIVTGSNMAGKSTLLRSIGLNLALALAGGPVTAEHMRVARVRLRASMRARDDLQRGASYFLAELTKLRVVVADADAEPPVFFLLDELLRGTNAHARHIGARCVLTHLLERGGMGLVATHDVALSELETERPEWVENAHFTDVVVDDEMTFDYRLRPGVVRTSNALRLLRLAGIEVPADDAVRD